MTLSGSPRVLLAGVDDATATVLLRELDGEADVRRLHPGEAAPSGDPLSSGDILSSGDPGAPTLLVMGAGAPAPAGLVGELRDRARGLALLLLTDPADTDPGGADGFSALALLAPAARLVRVPSDKVADLPRIARSLLDQLALQHAYRASRDAAQSQLLSGDGVPRRPGEHLFGPLHHQALVGAVAVDATARLIAWNRKAADILGLRAGATGRSFPLLFSPPAREDLCEHLARAALSPTPPALFERPGEDDVPQVLRMSAQSVTPADGPPHTLIILEDVTGVAETRRRLAERTGHALLSGDVAAAMTTGGPLPQRLRRSAQAVVDRLDAALVRVWICDPRRNTLSPRVDAGLRTPLDPGDAHSSAGPGDIEAGLVAAGRKPHLTNSMVGEPRLNDQEWARREGIVAFAGYPLITDGELMGVMALFARRPLPGTTLDALAGIADQIAVGISQDRVLGRLHSTARALQTPLLPPDLPRVPGLDLAARYRPQGDSLDIGGDFYDVFPLPDGRWVLMLGDVCGKGPAAAAVTGLVRHTLWTASQQDPDPGHVLPIVHRALERQNSPFCTLVHVVLDPPDPTDRSVRLRVTSAGHPAPLLRRRDGGTRLLDRHGPLLGAFPLTDLPVHATVLHPGDSLVLYTDGFTEGSGPHLMREPEDLASLVNSWAGPVGDPPAGQLADLLFDDALTRWAASGLRDDLALITLTAHP
ncbi:SpoIIE family protein phosphatase [Streptomyces sp. ST2-7A]|uniref:SpoIIE family protein phosphatase n=1 Tax=Streptomyces sp. ST2-7A TaxID=2907214 RepID=UPI001F2079F7|nr:SpoIIE family protein phosphatase [Streptomyces sp. ST2-7A]MCE7080372.1 SpoIIE family protein phosphatase [Streptomyces sp. ST2-7A]